MLRRFLAKIVLIFFGIALVAVPAEIVLRVRGTSGTRWTEDPKTGLLTIKPNAVFIAENSCLRQEVRANHLGFNDREHDPAKPADVFRIAILGDSFTEAMHVPRDKNFSSLVEAGLNALPGSHPRYEVLNFGITSHGTLENLLYWNDYAVGFKPDLAIDAFLVDNDVLEDAHSTRPTPRLDATGTVIPEQRTPRERVRSLLRHSRLALFLWNRLQVLRERAAGTPVSGAPGGVPFERQVYAASTTPFWDKAWKKEDALLSTFASSTAAHGARFLVMSLAEGFRVHPELLQKLGPAYQVPGVFDFDGPERRLTAITGRLQLPYLPLLPGFRRRAAGNPAEHIVWNCDGHWNEVGHRFAAAELTAYLAAHRELITRAVP